SGMCLQCDIIPDGVRPGWAANCEDTLAVGDAGLRAALAARHPDVWSRVQARQTFMRERLGITIADEILPLSAAPAYFAPFWLAGPRPRRELILRPGSLLLRSPHVQNAHMAIEADRLRLARDGGPPARTRPEAPMFPGGMEVGDEELEALARVIRGKNLFRYYG